MSTEPPNATPPKIMTVRDLRARLEGVPDEMLVFCEVSFDDGDGYEVAPLLLVDVECRCDGDAALYLFSDTDAEGFVNDG